MRTPSPGNRPAAPRRFLLLAEEGLDGDGRRPPIRRYLLSSLGSRSGLRGIGAIGPRTARSLQLTGRA